MINILFIFKLIGTTGILITALAAALYLLQKFGIAPIIIGSAVVFMAVVLYLDGDSVMQGVRKEIMTASASEMLNEAETVADAGTDYTLIIPVEEKVLQEG